MDGLKLPEAFFVVVVVVCLASASLEGQDEGSRWSRQTKGFNPASLA